MTLQTCETLAAAYQEQAAKLHHNGKASAYEYAMAMYWLDTCNIMKGQGHDCGI